MTTETGIIDMDLNKNTVDNCLIYHNKSKNVVLILTPRAGNTSLKKCLLNGELDTRHGAYDVLTHGIGMKRISIKHAYELKNKCTVVGFCRSPRDRFISSCYKWCKRNNSTVTEYMKMLLSTPQHEMDMHDRKQFWSMEYNDELIPHKLFKLESLIQPTYYPKFRAYMKGLGINTTESYPRENVSDSSIKNKIIQELLSVTYMPFIDAYCMRDINTFRY